MKAWRKSTGGIPPFILNFGTSSNQSIDGWEGLRVRLHVLEKKVPLVLLRIESRNRPVHRLCSITVILPRLQIVC
jgi:hypothetical protein